MAATPDFRDAGSAMDSQTSPMEGSPVADDGASDGAQREVEVVGNDVGAPDRTGDTVGEHLVDPPADGAFDVAVENQLDVASESFVDVVTNLDAATDAIVDAPSERLADAVVDVTCDVPILYYRDRDGDQFGVTGEHVLACTAPPVDDAGGWVTDPGDCRDDLPNVKPLKAGSPNPPQYSGTGYPDPVRPLGISFDFDCNGVETADPSNAYPAGPPQCSLLSLGQCSGGGYYPAVPARNGAGVNAYCGSTMVRICAGTITCGSQDVMTSPFRCR